MSDKFPGSPWRFDEEEPSKSPWDEIDFGAGGTDEERIRTAAVSVLIGLVVLGLAMAYLSF